jgi:hypothetical protein
VLHDIENFKFDFDWQKEMVVKAQRVITYNALQVKPATKYEKFLDKIFFGMI